MADTFNIIYLPEHILIQIFSYMSYSEISEKREVCQTFNRVCSRELTKAFIRVDRLHSQIQKTIKSQLPRKESERRNHALSRFVDILSAMETRLSLLSMTYTKYIDLDLCCFIPGKVLDEMYRLLRRLQNTTSQPPRSYDLLQSLRDLSTMAMEHFEEFIVPILKAHMNDCSQSLYFSTSTTSSPMQLNSALGSASFNSSMDMSGVSMLDYSWAMPIPIVSTPFRRTPLKLDVQRVQNQMQMHSAAIATMTKEYREQKVKIGEQSRIMVEQERKLQEQSLLVAELKAHVQAQEKAVEVLASHLTAITGKEVPLPEPHPWDKSLWELPPSGSSSQPEEMPAFSYTPDVPRESPMMLKFRQFVAECDAESKLKGTSTMPLPRPEVPLPTMYQRGRVGEEDTYPVVDPMSYHMNELCHGYSNACATQRLLFQVALLIPSIAANHSLPLCLADAPQERTVDLGKDPKGIILQQLTSAQRQLSDLFEEHVGCMQCGEAAAPPPVSLLSSTPFLPSSTTAHESGLYSSVAQPSSSHAPPPPPPHVANQGLMNRAQELYNRVQALSLMAFDKTGIPPPPPHTEVSGVLSMDRARLLPRSDMGGVSSLERTRLLPQTEVGGISSVDRSRLLPHTEAGGLSSVDRARLLPHVDMGGVSSSNKSGLMSLPEVGGVSATDKTRLFSQAEGGGVSSLNKAGFPSQTEVGGVKSQDKEALISHTEGNGVLSVNKMDLLLHTEVDRFSVEEEEEEEEPARSRGKGKALLKRRRPVARAKVDNGKADAFEAELPYGRSRKRRRR